ncbi:MAG: excinuclease ABC subunit UvrC [Bryobacterales bacterium]|nr:excinuclease ABC subunit UvrC [Bryobacteraceae bacterium]MDW8353684.1 excinuclease ABC subunit UvrC [Bryobacterales bacterium]
MDLRDKAAQLPAAPGVYLYKDAAGEVLYVGKAKNLRARVRSYFSDERLADAKTGTLIAEARDIDFILVDNEKEAMALENNLIKQWKPRFNVLLRDDKTYPYIQLTAEKYPRVYVTRRLKKDGSTYYGPYFPGNLAHRVVNFIHRRFQVPSCKVDLTRPHAQPCLEYHIHRCLGPCVPGLTTEEAYARAVHNVRLFLEGRLKDLATQLRASIEEASQALRFEEAAALRDLLATVEELQQRQKMAAAAGDDADIFGYYAEPPLVAVNVFHLRNGRVVDRREYFWEDQQEFDLQEFFSALVKQFYWDQQHIPARIHLPVSFDDAELLEEVLTERRGRKVEILTPQRGPKKALLDLAATNARQSFEQRFRVLKPSAQAIRGALQEILELEQPPRRIECFDISHIQGTDTVASMVVWEDGRMKKSDYRKFVIRSVQGSDDFAAMREVVTRRYLRVKSEGGRMPDLVLVDGGIGQLHAAAEALEAVGIINQPVAAIAKREEWIYVLGQEDEPVVLDRFSPVLHLIQQIRDEAHRFAVSFHRSRREARRLTSELHQIPGIGPKTAAKLLRSFGSLERLRQASEEELKAAVGTAMARRLREHFEATAPTRP